MNGRLRVHRVTRIHDVVVADETDDSVVETVPEGPASASKSVAIRVADNVVYGPEKFEWISYSVECTGSVTLPCRSRRADVTRAQQLALDMVLSALLQEMPQTVALAQDLVRDSYPQYFPKKKE